MPALPSAARRIALLAAGLMIAAPFAARAQLDNEGELDFPTTEFQEGAKSASVSVGDVTAGIRMVPPAAGNLDGDVPVLDVSVAGKPVLETAGVASGFEEPLAEASIAEIDPDNRHPEVYFTSFSGGAHCCAHVIVAEELGDQWIAVSVGDLDGDGNYLQDLNGDGLAEIVTVDNRFLYQFDCYACSAAPLVVVTVRGGKVLDVSADRQFLAAHREWLKQLDEDVDPDQRWTSPGFLAGWVAAKIRVGEGAEAWKALNEHWDLANDPGEEVCLTGGEPEDCARKNRVRLKFPERLKLFLEQSGYLS